jgi:hypothetical protein
MKPLSLLGGFLFSALLVVLFFSCKKELSCESCADNNKPPIADAGVDQTTVLPKDSVLLDGSGSTDPDGSIASYKWTKIAGPASLSIISATEPKTVVKSLTAGVYRFELQVTDDKGAYAKDTVMITVDAVPTANQPPVACAGADQVITLPVNTTTLDGSCSVDPDNNISTYTWAKIMGPSANIASANTAQTKVTNLTEGVYQFELKVTDAGGLFSKDTVQVRIEAAMLPPISCVPFNRPVINAQLVSIGTLSVRRLWPAIGAAGNKVLFAGGSSGLDFFSRVDIYNVTSRSWSTAELSQARGGMAVASIGTKVLFAGGTTSITGTGSRVSSRVDVYDVSTNSWTTAELSEPRRNIAAAVVGNKVFFGGGSYDGGASNTVDIYDALNNSWSTARLSQARTFLSAITASDKIYFAGGQSYSSNSGRVVSTIDIYDNTTNSWSVSSLSSPKSYMAAIFINGKIHWAGGVDSVDLSSGDGRITCQVEIKDVNTSTTSFTNLSNANFDFNAYKKGNKIVYLPGPELHNAVPPNQFDIYDLTTNTWLIGQLNEPNNYVRGSVISVNDTIYIAGHSIDGGLSGVVWKLEF